ncbi:unnamed protein product [Symbiodinium microadriaticum]|nr:unnamed protein product [Symbiodinium microadriaticum]
MQLSAPSGPQERVPRSGRAHSCSAVASAGYGSPTVCSMSPISPGPELWDTTEKAFLSNLSPSAASTTAPLEVSRPASEHQGPSSLSPERLTLMLGRRSLSSAAKDAVSRTDSPTPGSPWAEIPSLQSCVESQEKLSKAAKWAAARLGSGNEAVEAARRHLRDLRSRQSRLCFKATVRFHKETLAFELQELANGHAGFDDFQAALRAAEADLGQAHPVVEAARKKAHMIKLQQKAGAHKDLEARHCLDLLASSESRDLRVLAGSIQAAAKALGAAHPIVEKGRQEFLQQRHELQRHQWEECVAIHHTLMVEACESQDPEQIEARILASAHSPLGQGHDIVLYGKRYLLPCSAQPSRPGRHGAPVSCEPLRASPSARCVVWKPLSEPKQARIVEELPGRLRAFLCCADGDAEDDDGDEKEVVPGVRGVSLHRGPTPRAVSSSNSDDTGETMVRRLSEISTSSISFDASKLAMYKNFSGRSAYARDLDGEAVGRPSRRLRPSGYSSTRSAPIAERAEVEAKLEEEEEKKNKTYIENVQPSKVVKTTVISL